MIITCPSCQARYTVNAAAFAPSGKKVRCKKCGNVWRQAPLEGEAPRPAAPSVQTDFGLEQPAPRAGSFAAEPDVDTATHENRSDVESRFESAPSAAPLFEQAASEKKARKQERDVKEIQVTAAETTEVEKPSASKLRNFVQDAALTRRSRMRDILIWAALLVVIVATGLVFFFYKGNDWFDRKTAAVQEAAGQPINLRGIEFRNVSYERQTESGLPVLAVRGQVVNVSGEMRVLPPLRVGLSDGGDPPRELYHWTFTLPEKELAPGQSADFITRLSSPPSNARDLEVRFVLQGEEVGPAPAAPDAAATQTPAEASDAPILTPPATSAPDPETATSGAEGPTAP